MKRRVLILCTGNSCRSQMAEGLWRYHAGDEWEVCSAGLEPQGVNPLAVRAMQEVGIDISSQRSKSLDEYVDQHFDLVVTVCANAENRCPHFPNAKQRVHWPFEDPAAATGNDEQRLPLFRHVRDEISNAIKEWLGQQDD